MADLTGSARSGPVVDAAVIALALEDVLRGVPGVIAVYPSAPLPAVLVTSVLAAHTATDAPSLVSVTPSVGGSPTRVTAVVGVGDGAAAGDTARAADEAIRFHLASVGALPAQVTVRIGMVG